MGEEGTEYLNMTFDPATEGLRDRPDTDTTGPAGILTLNAIATHRNTLAGIPSKTAIPRRSCFYGKLLRLIAVNA